MVKEQDKYSLSRIKKAFFPFYLIVYFKTNGDVLFMHPYIQY